MPLLTEVLDYFIEEKPDLTQDFVSALAKSHTILDHCLLEDETVLDFHICHALYIITSICETIKTTYSHHAGAADISFSPDLQTITLNRLRNYLYHDFLIPGNTAQKVRLKNDLSELLSQLQRSLNKEITTATFSENAFLKRVDAILLEHHVFDPFEGQNIFLKARNIQELCTSFPTKIAVKTVRISKKNNAAQLKTLNFIIFGDNKGYLSILNNLDKSEDFEQPLEISAFSEKIKQCISKQLSLWAGDFFQEMAHISHIPGKSSLELRGFRADLLHLSKNPIDLKKNKFSEIIDILSININAFTNAKGLGDSFKQKAYIRIINLIQEEQKSLAEVLQKNTNEIDQPLIKIYVSQLDELFSAIDEIQGKLLEAENEKRRLEAHHHTELQRALGTLYRNKPEEYRQLTQNLVQAIGIQSSDMLPFLKQCTHLFIQFEDDSHPTHGNIAREAILTDINCNYTRIVDFIKIFRAFRNNPPLLNKHTTLPFFAPEMYLIVSMNTSLKMIENVERLSADGNIQDQIKYIRAELKMRNHHEIESLNPHVLHFFELISSYSGIGKSISNFRHYSLSLHPKIKENIQWLYAAFDKGTPYHSPDSVDMSTFTDLFNVQAGAVKSATGFNKAQKIMTLCFDTFNTTCFDRLLTYRLNTLCSQETEIKTIDMPLKIDLSKQEELNLDTTMPFISGESSDAEETKEPGSKHKIKVG